MSETTAPTVLPSRDLAVTLHAPEIVQPWITTAALKAEVDDVLSVLPADKQGCLLAMAKAEGDRLGAQLVVAQRMGDHWQIGGSLGWVPGTPVSARVVVRATW